MPKVKVTKKRSRRGKKKKEKNNIEGNSRVIFTIWVLSD